MAVTVTPTVHASNEQLMVELSIAGLDAGTNRIEVYDGTTGEKVLDRPAAGTNAVVFDYTAPVGEVHYRVEGWDNDDFRTGIGTTSVTTPEPPPNHVWISDPLDENSAFLAPLLIDGDRVRPRHTPIEMSYTLGGRGIASVSRTRRGMWEIVVAAETPEMVRHLQTFFTETSSLLIRCGSEMFLPGRLWGAVPTANESLRLYANPVNGRWHLQITPTGGPGISAVISTWTWDALTAYCEAHSINWDTLGDVFTTWLELERGPGEDA